MFDSRISDHHGVERYLAENGQSRTAQTLYVFSTYRKQIHICQLKLTQTEMRIVFGLTVLKFEDFFEWKPAMRGHAAISSNFIKEITGIGPELYFSQGVLLGH